jgi:8-oxo-dGTP pyrophosphatase MutT (NUDIX family)
MQTLSSRIVYQNRWMKVREDAVRRADGSDGIYGVVEKPDAVMILPIEGGKLHMVQQYRYTVGQRFWEFPQGAWEKFSNYTIEELARGELREETGLLAATLEPLGCFHIAYGFLSQPMHVFLATGLTQREACLEQEEQDLVHATFSWSDFHAMVDDGRVADACTLAGVSLLRLRHPELVG